MGSNTSKAKNEAGVQTQKIDTDVDPRSPTPAITRTPLQGKNSAKHNITKNADLRKNFENGGGEDKLIHNNPILSAVIKSHLLSYDPRSPTQDFERTPIFIASKINDFTNNPKEENQANGDNCGSPCLKDNPSNDDYATYDSCAEAQESPDKVVPKNLCHEFFDMTLDDTIKETVEPLGSSTASNEAIESDITPNNQIPEKPTQLLETNFEYVESNDYLDSVQEEIKNIPLFRILNEDPRSPSAGIERTPIVVAKIKNDPIEECVEEMSDDSLIKVLQNTNAELRQNCTKSQENPEELLIYEDESATLQDTPRKAKCGSSSGLRTPLSCMKNKGEGSHTRSKSANTICDPKDKQQYKKVSHIPRLKSLSKQYKLSNITSSVSLKNISKPSVVSGDCENTPPHSHRDLWDKDNSIVL